jgi:drug/metabolite transporter (DMT)-like permease
MENTMIRKEPSRLLIMAAFAAIYIIWGSTYIAMLTAIRDLQPLTMSGIRFLTAGAILIAFCLAKKESIPDHRSIAKISFSGILMLFLGTGAVAWVEQYIPSSVAAIIVATVPLWFVLLDRKNWSSNFSNKWIITGLLVGFAGVMTLFSGKGSISFTGDPMKLISFFVMVFGAVAWAAGSLYSKYQPANGSTGMKASIQMIAAGLTFVAASAVTGEYGRVEWNTVSQQSLWALLYLIFVGSLIGYMSYVWLLTVRSPAVVGTYAYVNPVVAVFLGWLIASEPIGIKQVIALAVILAGVILVTLSREGKPKS